MAAITDLSDLINLQTGGGSAASQAIFFYKVARIAGAAVPANIAGRPCTLWRYDGQPSAGAVPTSVIAPTDATPGALPFISPGGLREAFMVQAWATGLVGGTLILYDRLLQIGGLSGIVTTPQTVSGSITRNVNGDGNFIMAEIYTAIGSTARTITATYTDQDGNGGTTTAVAFGGTGFLEATRAILMPLASGDTGVRAVGGVTINGGSTGTAGNFGVVIGKPIAYIGIGAAGAAGWRDYVTGLPGIPAIASGSCLSLLWIPTTTTAPEIFGGYNIVEK